MGWHSLKEKKQEESRAEGWVGSRAPRRDWEVGATAWIFLGHVYVFGEVGSFFLRNLGEALAVDHMPLVIDDFFLRLDVIHG